MPDFLGFREFMRRGHKIKKIKNSDSTDYEWIEVYKMWFSFFLMIQYNALPHKGHKVIKVHNCQIHFSHESMASNQSRSSSGLCLHHKSRWCRVCCELLLKYRSTAAQTALIDGQRNTVGFTESHSLCFLQKSWPRQAGLG